MLSVLIKILNGLEHSLAWGVSKSGQAAAWLVIPIALTVVLSIVLSNFNIGVLYTFSETSMFFGDRITLIGLGELQWHLFGTLCFISFGWAYITDSHVRVDILTENLTDKTKALLSLLGFFLFLLPFCITVLIASFDFALRSYNIGEGSAYDGMQSRFIIKAVIPVGFFLVLAAGSCRAVTDLKSLFSVSK